MDWEDVVKVSRFLTVTLWKRWISGIATPPQGSHAVPSILDSNKMSENLLYSLIRCRRVMSRDPRDKIHALLGIVGDSVWGRSRLAPIYCERSVLETYTLAVVQILKDLEDLLLLSCAEGDEFRTVPSLPSWDPDWSCRKIFGLGITGYTRFLAAGQVPRAIKINERDGYLTVKGFLLATIDSTGETKRHVLSGEPFRNWRSIFSAMPSMYHTGQSQSELFWRTLVTDTTGVDRDHPAKNSYHSAFVSWITKKLSRSSEESPQYTGGSPFMETLVASVATEITASLPSSDEAHSLHNEHVESPKEYFDYETVFSHAVHL